MSMNFLSTINSKLNSSNKNIGQGRTSNTNILKLPNGNNVQLQRRQNKIQIDKTFDDRIQDFVNSFPDGSLSK